VITICRPEVRNAVDRATALALTEAFDAFSDDDRFDVAILTGSGGTFCAGADLKAISSGEGNRLETGSQAPMGPTRSQPSKPVIAAVEGHAVAGGLELAIWCDLRVVADDAIFGVFCRRWGVPLIDGGTVRLPRLIGAGRAMDMILTGRRVDAAEAKAIGLADRVVASGATLVAALELAQSLTKFPQPCMRADRLNALTAFEHSIPDALSQEFERSLPVAQSCVAGAQRFADGEGRGGSFVDIPRNES
jgi:enoyl-CoA hydratase